MENKGMEKAGRKPKERKELKELYSQMEKCIEDMEKNGYMKNEVTDPQMKRLAYASGYLENDYPEISEFLWKILIGKITKNTENKKIASGQESCSDV